MLQMSEEKTVGLSTNLKLFKLSFFPPVVLYSQSYYCISIINFVYCQSITEENKQNEIIK